MVKPRFKGWKKRDSFAHWTCTEWEPRVLAILTQPALLNETDFIDVAKSGPVLLMYSQVQNPLSILVEQRWWVKCFSEIWILG